MKGTDSVQSLETSVFVTEEDNIMVNSDEWIGTTNAIDEELH
jgi:hypothetical protein